VLVTDQWVSPIAGLASSVLIARTGPPSPLESLASATVLVEALVAAVVDHLGPEVGARIAQLAEISATLIPNWHAPGES
jgi:DNA-binding MurR/RpiR family transcriptional regulator